MISVPVYQNKMVRDPEGGTLRVPQVQFEFSLRDDVFNAIVQSPATEYQVMLGVHFMPTEGTDKWYLQQMGENHIQIHHVAVLMNVIKEVREGCHVIVSSQQSMTVPMRTVKFTALMEDSFDFPGFKKGFDTKMEVMSIRAINNWATYSEPATTSNRITLREMDTWPINMERKGKAKKHKERMKNAAPYRALQNQRWNW